MSISEQFFTKIILATWIAQSSKTLKVLRNKIGFISDPEMYPDDTVLWSIGPIANRPDKLFVYLQTKTGSTTKEIYSINPIPESCYFMVFCSDMQWHKLDKNRSAYALAKTLDMFLHGHYTDVPPLGTDELLDMLEEGME